MNGRALLLAATLLLGCAGPEARLQPPPAPAPDLAQPPAPPSDPAPAAADAGLPLAAFVERVLAEYRRDPGPLALLPALSDDPRQAPGTQVFATRAGDWIAARTGELLAAAGGVEVWAPDAVERELRRANRSLAAVRRPADLLALLHRAQASYLVCGEMARVEVGGRLRGEVQVRVDWRCTRVADGAVVASMQQPVSDPGSRARLLELLRETSPVAIGSRAPQFAPSLDDELRWAVREAVQRLARGDRARLAGATCAVRAGAPGGAGALGTVTLLRDEARATLPRLFLGDDAIAVADREDAAPAIDLRLQRAAAAWSLQVTASGGRGGAPHDVRVPIDPMFTTDLDRRLQ